MKKTALNDEHIKLNAKILPFAGYYMPITYGKIIDEYNAVRKRCGIFDVSHMGQIEITGSNSANYLDYVTTNNISNINNLEAQYSAICNHKGNFIDDIIIFKFKNDRFMIIANASNVDKVLNFLNDNNKDFNVNINYLNDNFSLIALQGPRSRNLLKNISDKKIDLDFYSLKNIKILNNNFILSRTGYTGELGFEIIGKHDDIIDLWKYFISKNVKPCGLAVRDILRSEMKYCLYGNDIDETVNPFEAGLSWITDLNKEKFIAKNAFLNIKEKGISKKLIGFKMIDKSIPRKDYSIYKNGEKIGIVTSGVHSPILEQGIGLGYVNTPYNKVGYKIQIQIRNRFMDAIITKTPFLQNTSLHK